MRVLYSNNYGTETPFFVLLPFSTTQWHRNQLLRSFYRCAENLLIYLKEVLQFTSWGPVIIFKLSSNTAKGPS